MEDLFLYPLLPAIDLLALILSFGNQKRLEKREQHLHNNWTTIYAMTKILSTQFLDTMKDISGMPDLSCTRRTCRLPCKSTQAPRMHCGNSWYDSICSLMMVIYPLIIGNRYQIFWWCEGNHCNRCLQIRLCEGSFGYLNWESSCRCRDILRESQLRW